MGGNPLAEISALLNEEHLPETEETSELLEAETLDPEQAEATDAPEQAEAAETPSDEFLDLSTIKSVHDLETAGVDTAWLYGLEIPMPDGEKPITLGEAKDRITSVTRAQKDLSEQYEHLRQTQQQMAQLLNLAQTIPEEVQEAAATLRALQVRQGDEQFWQALEQRDPARAALQRQKVGDAVKAAQQQLQQKLQVNQQVQMAHFDAVRRQELANVIRVIPEWRDGALAQQETQAVGQMLQAYGFSGQEIDTMLDHRLIHLANDLMRLRKQDAAAKQAVTKLRKAPKVLRSGPAAPRSSMKQAQQAQLAKRAKSLGTPEAQRAAVANLLNLEGIR